MTRLTRDAWAMELAKVTAKRSTCLRRAVGCVLLNARGHVLSTGYNGVAAGLPHCNEWGEDTIENKMGFLHACPGATSKSGTNLDGCGAIHAEQNALLQCRDPYSIESCYVTTSPCMTCTKLLLNTSCKEIIFDTAYPDYGAAMKMWVDASGRDWVKLSER